MTAYPPRQPVRKLTRSRSNKMLGGVCAGVANYLNMDVNLVRILTVVLSLFTGVPIVAYVVMLLVVPEEDVAPYVPGPPAPSPGPAPSAATAAGTDPVWGAQGAPWEADQTAPSAAASDPDSASPAAESAPLQESSPADSETERDEKKD